MSARGALQRLSGAPDPQPHTPRAAVGADPQQQGESRRPEKRPSAAGEGPPAAGEGPPAAGGGAPWNVSAEGEKQQLAGGLTEAGGCESLRRGPSVAPPRAPREEEQQCDLQQQQQQQQKQQQGEQSEEERRTEATSSCCAVCGKGTPQSDGGDEGTLNYLCGACNTSKQQQQQEQEEQPVEGPTAVADEGAGAAAAAAAAAEDLAEGPESVGSHDLNVGGASKAAGTGGSVRSSSGGVSVSGPSVSSAAASRSRCAAAAAASGGALVSAASAAVSRKCIDEGSKRRHVVPVGPRHQVPCLPPFFLEAGRQNCCCGGETTPVLDPSLTARLVYSPSSLERVRQRRLAEGLADRAICSEGDMEAYMHQCAKNWKANKPGWQPFSPEFAFKLLHYAGYDPAKALQLMEDPQFPFQLVCDGPVRRYDNKWRPKDRRGVISPTPYPPPVFLRGYLSRRHYRDNSGYSLR